MAHELECKIAVNAHEPLIERLRAAGAKRIGRVRETNRLLDTAEQSLFQRGCGLRVRSVEVLDGDGPGSTLTFKGPVLKSAFKRREEVEIEIPTSGGNREQETGNSGRDEKEGAEGSRGRGAEGARRGGECQMDDSAAGMLRLLTALGYEPWLTFEKIRESWRFESCAIELDTVPLVGRFVEIEAPDEAAIRRGLDLLGLNPVGSIKTSYAGLLANRMEGKPPPWVVLF